MITPRKRRSVILLAIGLLVPGVVWWANGGFETLDRATMFSSDYDYRAFRQIRVGDPFARVRELIGDPLYQDEKPVEPFIQRWYYDAEDLYLDVNTCGDRLVEAVSSPDAVVSGETLGTLVGRPVASRRAMRVLDGLGERTRIETIVSCYRLWYSWPEGGVDVAPWSRRHWVRGIFLDGETQRVRYILAGYYWDT